MQTNAQSPGLTAGNRYLSVYAHTQTHPKRKQTQKGVVRKRWTLRCAAACPLDSTQGASHLTSPSFYGIARLHDLLSRNSVMVPSAKKPLTCSQTAQAKQMGENSACNRYQSPYRLA